MLGLSLVGGLIALVIGGELLIKGASNIASKLGIPRLIIGLTIVALGTSAPELVVSLKASLAGNPSIAVANVVGSNIFNILFILGICALFSPLVVTAQLVRLDLPVMLLATVLFYVFALDQSLGFTEGLILVSSIVIYTIFLIFQSSKSETEKAELSSSWLLSIIYIGAGLGFLVLGGGWLVDGAITLAKNLGVDDRVIGLTIVAAGTSLPEVATSIMATIKGERDLAIGNVVGSNIYNILAILGVSALFTPAALTIPKEMLRLDLIVMLIASLLCLPIFFTGYRINRWEGALFLASYVAFTTYLVMKA